MMQSSGDDMGCVILFLGAFALGAISAALETIGDILDRRAARKAREKGQAS